VKRFKHGARLCLHAMARVALRLRATPYSSDSYPVTLVIAPHPDDGTLGCGALIARRRLDGLVVHELVVTDGSASHPRHPTESPERIAELRHAEECEAMRRLGVDEARLHFLNATDGMLNKLSSSEAEAIERGILAVLVSVRPDEILVPCRFDGSSEHDACFGLVSRALAKADIRPRVLEYPIWSWWNPLRTFRTVGTARRIWRVPTTGTLIAKRQALAAYVSQAEPTAPWTEPALPLGFILFFISPAEYFFEMEQLVP